MLASRIGLAPVRACRRKLRSSAVDDVRTIAASACFRTGLPTGRHSRRPAVQLRRTRQSEGVNKTQLISVEGRANLSLTIPASSCCLSQSLSDSDSVCVSDSLFLSALCPSVPLSVSLCLCLCLSVSVSARPPVAVQMRLSVSVSARPPVAVQMRPCLLARDRLAAGAVRQSRRLPAGRDGQARRSTRLTGRARPAGA